MNNTVFLLLGICYGQKIEIIFMRDRVTAIEVFSPDTCLMYVVYSEIEVICRCCLADQGSPPLVNVSVKGFAVCKSFETPDFEVKPKMLYSEIKCDKLPIKSAIFMF
ncbi:hypothetical protein RF11_10899 [Thelohanellus kitauei]|uniref:Uncharacterized protein n=1 Tax=Thelohanellus kitauei TaxID=669202 RepID=A0A0C2MIW0_THEKT|nr:hypothetical protein RF11_10899 [Thelohanellus kitauei]